MSGSKGDDNMEFSDSESDEPRRYKSGASEKSIAHLKVNITQVLETKGVNISSMMFVYRRKMTVCDVNSRHTKMK